MSQSHTVSIPIFLIRRRAIIRNDRYDPAWVIPTPWWFTIITIELHVINSYIIFHLNLYIEVILIHVQIVCHICSYLVTYYFVITLLFSSLESVFF